MSLKPGAVKSIAAATKATTLLRAQAAHPLDSAFSKHGNRLGDPALASLDGLGTFDREHKAQLVAIGETFKDPGRLRTGGKSRVEVVRYAHLPRFGVEFDVDINLVAGCNTGTVPYLRADSKQKLSAHGRDTAAVGVSVYRHPNRRPPARSQGRNEFFWNPNPGGGLAVQLDCGPKLHTPGSPPVLLMR